MQQAYDPVTRTSSLLAVMLILCLSFSATCAARSSIDIVTYEFPPYTGNEIDNTGFLTEIVKAAFKAGGVTPSVSALPWARAKSDILQGRRDAIFPANFEEAREINAEPALLYKTAPIIFVARQQDSIPWNGYIDSLNGYEVGVIRGFAYTTEFDQATGFSKQPVSSHQQNFRKLLKERIDLLLVDELTAHYYLNQEQLAKRIRFLTPPLINSSEFYLAFSQSQGQRIELQTAFEAGLQLIHDNGRYDQILKQFNVSKDIVLQSSEVEVVKFDSHRPATTPTGSGVLPRTIKQAASEMVIGFCGFHWQTDGYQRTYEKVLLEEAKRHGVTLKNFDAKASIDQQIEQINSLIEQQVDLIAVWPVHGKRILPALKQAKSAGIPVIIVNTPVDVSGFDLIRAYTGPNNIMEGRLAAQMMVEALGGKGTVVEIQGFPGYSTAIERSLGFADELERQKQQNPAIDIEIIDVISGYWSREKAEQAAERLIRRHRHFDGLYVGDDNMGVGAIKALEKANRLAGVVITSATLFGDGYDAIKAGKIYGSVWQSPSADAKLALDTAIRIIRGEDVEFYNFFPVPRVTRENIDQLDRPLF